MRTIVSFLLVFVMAACSSDDPAQPEKPNNPDPSPTPAEELPGSYKNINVSLGDFLDREKEWKAESIVGFLKTVNGVKDIKITEYNVEFYTSDDYFMGVQLEPFNSENTGTLTEAEIAEIIKEVQNSVATYETPDGENFSDTQELFTDLVSLSASGKSTFSRDGDVKVVDKSYRKNNPVIVSIWQPIRFQRQNIEAMLKNTSKELYHGSYYPYSSFSPYMLFRVLINQSEKGRLKFVFMETHGTPDGLVTLPVEILKSSEAKEYLELSKRQRNGTGPMVQNLFLKDENKKYVLDEKGNKIETFCLLPSFYDKYLPQDADFSGTFAYTSICYIHGNPKKSHKKPFLQRVLEKKIAGIVTADGVSLANTTARYFCSFMKAIANNDHSVYGAFAAGNKVKEGRITVNDTASLVLNLHKNNNVVYNPVFYTPQTMQVSSKRRRIGSRNSADDEVLSLNYRIIYELKGDGTTPDSHGITGVLVKNLKTGVITDIQASPNINATVTHRALDSNMALTEIGVECPSLPDGEYVYAAYIDADGIRNIADKCYKFEAVCDRLIYSENDLIALSGLSGGEAIVMADFTVSKPFSVNYTMHGNHHKLTINLPDAKIGGSGIIKDLEMEINNYGASDIVLFDGLDNNVSLRNCTLSKLDGASGISAYAYENCAVISDCRFDLPFCKNNADSIRNCVFSVNGETCGVALNRNSGVIEDCRIEGDLSGYGVCNINSGVISGCENNANGVIAGACAQNNKEIKGFINRGNLQKSGICESNFGIISDCENYGTAGDKKMGGYRAGICGYNYEGGTVENCRNFGEITGMAYHQNHIYIGGIVGVSNGEVINVSNTGNIKFTINSWTGNGGLYLYAATIGCGKVASYENSGKIIRPETDQSGKPGPATLPSTIITGDVIPL